jgi:type I restriction enzyme S subunit
MKLFRAGDILVARRNVYLKRAAIADFDGVCSGDAIVLRPKQNQLISDGLLQFVLNTDLFWDYAIKHAAGTMSKRLSVKNLLGFEFALPPNEDQTRVVDLLSAIERVSTSHEDIAHHASNLCRVLFSDCLNREWSVIELGSVVQGTQYGLSINAGSDGQYPILRMMNLEDGLCVENDIKYVDLNDKDFEAYRLVHGDVLFNRTNSYELVGRTGVYELDGDHVFASYLVRVKTNPEKLEPKFLTLYLNSDFGRRQVLAYATKAVSQANVNASNLLRVRLPLPPLEVQQQLLDKIARAKSAERAATVRRSSAEEMKKQLLAEIVGGAE